MKTFLGLFMCICSYSFAQMPLHQTNGVETLTTHSTVSKKYLALGDSYTIGQGVGEEERFPFLATQALAKGGVQIQGLKYLATTGWTTRHLLSAIGEGSGGNYDAVTLLIGVNDHFYGVDTSVYRKRFLLLLQKATRLAGNNPAHVFVLSIPDYSATPFISGEEKSRVSKEIDIFNNINREVTLQNKVAYIDITQLSREVAKDPTLLASDKLHYSRKEHQKWADLLVPLMRLALK
ncbi:MAG: SGNH/GDSL hydrolase family protein [Chitinophagaceae bacterium]